MGAGNFPVQPIGVSLTEEASAVYTSSSSSLR